MPIILRKTSWFTPRAAAVLTVVLGLGFGLQTTKGTVLAQPQPEHPLVVRGGSGSAGYASGETVHVWANATNAGDLFSHWEGDASLLDHPEEPHATLNMPDRAVSLRAVLRPAATWAPARLTLDGLTIFVEVPGDGSTAGGPVAETVGVVVLAHRASGEAAEWFNGDRPEQRNLSRALVAHGYAVVAIDSLDRRRNAWDTSWPPQNNVDVPRVEAALDALVAEGVLDPRWPRAALGFSNGATFAGLLAEALDFEASVLYANGLPAALDASGTTPSLFVLGRQDITGVNARGEASYAALAARDVQAELSYFEPQPLHPLRFWGIIGANPGHAREIHEDLRNAGYLDDKGFLRESPRRSDWRGAIRAAHRDLEGQIYEQLQVAYADHTLSAEVGARVLDFLDAHVLPGPRPTPTPFQPGPETPYRVLGGCCTGTGEVVLGSRNRIFADPAPTGRVFDRWVVEPPRGGDRTSVVDEPRARNTTVEVLGATVVSATYRAAAPWTPEEVELEGHTVYFYAPPDPVGIVVALHGSGGSAAGWVQRARSAEKRLFLDDAVARGYAVLVPESIDRQARQWDLTTPADSNADVAHVAAAVVRLQALPRVADDAPVFALGMSNGGAFSSIVADALKMDGGAVFGAAGRTAVMRRTGVPFFWGLGARDSRVDNMRAVENHELLLSRGIPTGLYVLRSSPVYATRFAQETGIDADTSRQIHAAMTTAGIVDDQDRLTGSIKALDWSAELPKEIEPVRGRVAEQLDVSWADHVFFADANVHVLDFFDAARGEGPEPTPSPTPGATMPSTATATPGPPTATPTRPMATEAPPIDQSLYLPWALRR